MATKILVADDQLHMLRLMQHELEQEGYELLQARDGEEAIGMALRERPDLVILAVMMPQVDGLTALRRLRQEKSTRSIRATGLTGSPREPMLQEAELSGADMRLTKP